ncbi:MAG: hypothetical protein ACE5J5_06630 [Candidatus Hydrothermarchaeales archaeon]
MRFKREDLWHWIVFTSALIALIALIIDLLYKPSPGQKNIIDTLLFLVIGIFAIDLYKEHQRFKGTKKAFFEQHWLEILAIIPLFRIFRMAELVGIEEIAEMERIEFVEKGEHIEEKESQVVHAEKLEEKDES